MRVFLTPRAEKEYEALPPDIKPVAKKQFKLLAQDLRYPSLHAKKYDEAKDRWQGRITRDYRFYFEIEEDVYVVVAAGGLVERHTRLRGTVAGA